MTCKGMQVLPIPNQHFLLDTTPSMIQIFPTSSSVLSVAAEPTLHGNLSDLIFTPKCFLSLRNLHSLGDISVLSQHFYLAITDLFRRRAIKVAEREQKFSSYEFSKAFGKSPNSNRYIIDNLYTFDSSPG